MNICYMKKIIFLVLILATDKSLSYDFCIPDHYTINFSHRAEIISSWIKKYIGYIIFIPVTAYYHTPIIESIINHPYLASCIAYLAINYSCDCILNYQKQQLIVTKIMQLKKIMLYYAVVYGIKNFMHHEYITARYKLYDKCTIDLFYNSIVESSNYKLIMYQTMYKELINILHQINHYITIESEEFILLQHPELIDFDSLIYITRHDENLQGYIVEFQTNPQQYFQSMVIYLTCIIKELLDQLHDSFSLDQTNAITEEL